MNIIVSGSLSYDYIMAFPERFADRIMPDKIHQISLSFLVDKLEKQYGGTAGNIAYTLKLLGVDPLIVSCVGNDFDVYKAFLRMHKIHTQYIKEYKNIFTSSYFVVTDKDDNQIGSFYTGAMRHASKQSLRSVKEECRLVMLAPNDPKAMIKHVGECRSSSMPYIYDPAFQIATFTADNLREGIEGARILIGNDYEIALIEQKVGITHEKLCSMVPVVITTLGNKGSVIEAEGDSIHIPPANVESVADPTGAGDAYRAGFIAGYMRGFDLEVCGRMGSVAASYTVELYGTVTHEFAIMDFVKRYQDNYKKELIL